MNTPTPLQNFFALAWDAFLEGSYLDGPDLECAIHKSGLGVRRPATEADIEAGITEGVELGDIILVLSDAGKEALEPVREQEKVVK